MNNDLTFLASRYLDDDLDADERAQVEQDRELLAEVERLRAVRDELAAFEPPSAERREAAIEAALSVFDAAPPRRAAVVPLASRRTWQWLMPAAAAIIGVLALGGLVVLVGTSAGGDDDDASDAVLQDVAATDGADELAPEGTEAAGGAGTTADGDQPFSAAESTTGGTTAASAAPGTTAAAADTAAGTAAASQVIPFLSSPDELVDYATAEQFGEKAPADREVERRAANCNLGSFIGPADYLTPTGAVETVVIVEDEDEVLAIDFDCNVIARAPLP